MNCNYKFPLRICQALALLVGLAVAAHASDMPDLNDLLASHTLLSEKIVTGRITLVLHRTRNVDSLEEDKHRNREKHRKSIQRIERSDMPPNQKAANLSFFEGLLRDSDASTMAVHLSRTGIHKVSFRFDSATNSYCSVLDDTRDHEAVVQKYDLGQSAINFHALSARALSGDYETTYNSGANTAGVGLCVETYRIECQDLLRAGYLPENYCKSPFETSLAEDPEYPGLLKLTATRRNFLIEMLLDPQLQNRVVQMRIFHKGAMIQEETCAFGTYGGILFPSEFVRREFDAEGVETKASVYTTIAAELNVAIDPAEFKIRIPENASLFDKSTLRATPWNEFARSLFIFEPPALAD